MDATAKPLSGKNSLSIVQTVCFRANGGDWHGSLSWVVKQAVTYETLRPCFDAPCRPHEFDLKIEAAVGWWVTHRHPAEAMAVEPVAGPYQTNLDAADALAFLLREGAA